LPPNLQELNLTGNLVDEFLPLRQPQQSLISLGLAFNRIRNPALATVCKNFPNLFCLDVSYNELSDFKSSVTWIEELFDSLKMLFLQGNPLSLVEKYKDIIKQRFPDLRILDGEPAFTEAEEAARKKIRKRAIKNGIDLKKPSETKGIELIPIPDNLSFELQLRLFQNVAGIYLNEQNV